MITARYEVRSLVVDGNLVRVKAHRQGNEHVEPGVTAFETPSSLDWCVRRTNPPRLGDIYIYTFASAAEAACQT